MARIPHAAPRRLSRTPGTVPAAGTPPPSASRGTRQRQTQAEAGSEERILEAALVEFAGRGFAGARVDRIAAAARLNKAMIYYHFASKAGLYRAAIQRLLGTLAVSLETVADGPLPPGDKLRAFITTFVGLGLEHPRIAPLLLREVAEGATHIDQDTARFMLRIVAAMRRILDEGQRSGVFRQVNPLLAYLTTVWPIMVYLASGPMRQVLFRHAHHDTSALEPDAFTRHMQDITIRSLAADLRPGRPTATGHRHTEHAR